MPAVVVAVVPLRKPANVGLPGVYFLKSMSDGQTGPVCPLDLTRYLEQFDFFRYVYPAKIDEYIKLLHANRSLVADIAVAVVTTLFPSELVHKVISKHAVDCCRDILEDTGFPIVTEDTLRSTLFSDRVPNVLMVAGCQDETMLVRRVKAAVDFVCKFDKNFDIVFSGRSPAPAGTKPVRIRNESKLMGLHFSDLLLKKNRDMPKLHYLEFESESSTTRTNVSKFFNGGFVGDRSVSTVILISSTFHLIRLGREACTFLNAWEHRGAVGNLVLVGAESAEQKLYPEDLEYFKLMMFDVFDYLIQRGEGIAKVAAGP